MIKLEGISKYYNSDANVVLGLRKVSLELKLGEFVAITGESGSGKSTLLNVISGLDKYDEGEMFVNGEETSYFSIEEQEQYRKQYIGFVFQNYNIIDSFTVLENVMAALMIQGYDPKKRKARALELIDKVGLTSHKNHRASKLSGGQKQRAVIARALAKDCPIIVADEPTGNLDSKTGLMIMALLKEVSKDKLVVVVTHNYEQAEPYVTRKIRLSDGEIVEDKPIKPKEEVSAYEPKPTVNLALLDVLKLAFVSIFRMPKKSVLLFVTLLFALVSSASLLSLNNFIPEFLAGGGADGGYTYNRIFSNNYKERLIVKKKDNSKITQAEIDELYNITGVKSVIHNDYLNDIDFEIKTAGDSDSFYSNSVKALPVSAARESMLADGTLPTDDKTIVVSEWLAMAYPIGTEIELITMNLLYGSNFEVYGKYKMTVSGVAKLTGNGNVIVHDSFLNQSLTNLFNPNNMIPILSKYDTFNLTYDNYQIDRDYIFSYWIDNSIEDDYVFLGEFAFYSLASYIYQDQEPDYSALKDTLLEISLTKRAFEKESRVATVKVANEPTLPHERRMNFDTFIKLFGYNDMYQVTLVLDNVDNLASVRSKIDDSLITFHPASAKTQPNYSAVGFTTMTNFVFVVLAIFIYIILNLVLKSIIQSRKKDFVIFRSIGASQIDLKRMLMLEQVLYVSIAFVLMFIPLVIMNIKIEEFKVLEYLKFRSYLLIYGAFLVILLMIARKFSIRLFGRSVITTLKSE